MGTQYPTIDPSTICATRTRKGVVYPAMDQHVSSRFVPIEEAKARGWPMYYDGQACRCSHQAARWVSNPDRCSDCVRVRDGKPAIYPTARGGNFYEEPRRKETPAAAPFVIAAPALPELDATDKKYLAALADTKDHVKAAHAANSTAALIEARRSSNAQFAAAATDLEKRLDIRRAIAPSTAFEWDDVKRARYIEVFIDTGAAADARDAIGVSASQFFKHVAENPDFATAVGEAAPLAARALEDVAVSMARRGQDRLLAKILAAKLPAEYSEKVKIDVTNRLEDLTDEQLNERLRYAYIKFRKRRGGEVIDAEFSAALQSTAGIDSCADGSGSPLLLSRDGSDARLERARGSGASADGDTERQSTHADIGANNADLL
jgi:hypothetical protein